VSAPIAFGRAALTARIRQRPVHGPGRRLLDWFRARLRKGVGKSQRAYFVSVNKHRFKRVVFGDRSQAVEVAAALEACRAQVGLPELVLAQEAEVWVRFVEGRKVDPAAESDWNALNDFFGALYAKDSQPVDLTETTLHSRLQIDLGFLRDSGVLDKAQYAALLENAERLAPDQIWLGYDYVDPVLKNFVINDSGLFAIDIESLERDIPLGTGIAKSGLHWLGEDRDRFLNRLRAQPGVPDFASQQDYVELCFLSGWTKRKLLTGKWSRIQADRFDRFRRA